MYDCFTAPTKAIYSYNQTTVSEIRDELLRSQTVKWWDRDLTSHMEVETQRQKGGKSWDLGHNEYRQEKKQQEPIMLSVLTWSLNVQANWKAHFVV